MNDEKILLNHLRDLAARAENGGYYTYSDFLTLAEQDAFLREKIPFDRSLFGGTENAERKIAVFGSERAFGYEEAPPVAIVKAAPLSKKFADALSHRDFLGAVTSLGLDRRVTGDIVLCDNEAYIFCLDSIADFIAENLTKVKHTDVKCERVLALPENAAPHIEEKSVFVASERADALIAAVFDLSRSESEKLFSAKLVFADSKLIEDGDTRLTQGAVISVRGYGRFIYGGISKTTRKGRLVVDIKMYK